MASENSYTDIFGLKIPKLATKPAVLFMAEHLRLGEFIYFAREANLFLKRRFDALHTEIIDLAARSKTTDYFIRVYGDKLRDVLSLEYHEPLMAEMIICRMAENFLVYLKQLLALIFRARPDTLKSGEQERLDFILQYSTMEDLIFALADKRVEELSFRGMRDLAAYFDRLGLTLFPSPDDMELAIRIIEIRNVIVHSRGVVSNIFKKRIPDYPTEVGERLKLDFKTANSYETFLANSTYEIDRRAGAKFKLPQLPLGVPSFGNHGKENQGS